MRRKCFLARVLVSSFKYKLGLSPYYLVVNHMSDWSPEEVAEKLHGRREPEVAANATLSCRKRQSGLP